MSKEDFYTFSEYMKKSDDALTASMEDYLEMIYRLSVRIGFTRIHDLAQSLNVQPPSATKMVQKLSEMKLINYEKYGIIILTEEGKSMGKYLLDKHNTIEDFLKLMGVCENLLEQTEKIEHTINDTTLKCLNKFIHFIQENPEIIGRFEQYQMDK